MTSLQLEEMGEESWITESILSQRLIYESESWIELLIVNISDEYFSTAVFCLFQVIVTGSGAEYLATWTFMVCSRKIHRGSTELKSLEQGDIKLKVNGLSSVFYDTKPLFACNTSVFKVFWLSTNVRVFMEHGVWMKWYCSIWSYGSWYNGGPSWNMANQVH
jgi:hypothetical protein